MYVLIVLISYSKCYFPMKPHARLPAVLSVGRWSDGWSAHYFLRCRKLHSPIKALVYMHKPNHRRNGKTNSQNEQYIACKNDGPREERTQNL